MLRSGADRVSTDKISRREYGYEILLGLRYRTVVLSALSCPVVSCLSVTLVYCGQTVGWINMKLCMQVGLGPGHIVLDGDPATPPQRDTAPQFSAHICSRQMARWIKMPLGMEVRLVQAIFC